MNCTRLSSYFHLLFTNISAASSVTNLLFDEVSVNSLTRTLPGPFLGLYMRGDYKDSNGSPAPPALVTTVPFVATGGSAIKWEAPRGINCGGTGCPQ